MSFGKTDVVFLSQPFHQTVSPLYRSSYFRKFAKVAYVPYGHTLVNSPQSLYRLPFFEDCWRIFVESERHCDLYAKNNPSLVEKILVTGHPKMDTYREPPKQSGVRKKPTAKTLLIWAPHWTVCKDNSSLTFSKFFDYFDFFLAFAKAHPNIEIVMRPHPELFENAVNSGMRSRKSMEDYWKSFDCLPNAQVYEGGCIFDLFKMSSALILDSIGFIAEYLPTERPICFLDSTHRQKLNYIGENILKSCYKAWNSDEIVSFVENVVVNGDDSLREMRLSTLAEYIFMPPSGAGLEIKTHVAQGILQFRSKPTRCA